MTVEQMRNESSDQFPVGMHVLAVDDDPICLRLLETLLRKCQYHVTTTSQAITALEMLRENKNKFDLVISDVHMPDMDGFKLLELVGLEMDLPVIMLSANGDTKLVMKGITHGACDYLLKPVRLEELKNIWQHVVRRKKSDSRDPNSYNSRDNNSVERNKKGLPNSDHDVKLNKKRKDQNVEDDEDEEDEYEHENEDLSTQKRPRVVWSVELHRKFVAAVNQLGLDKAVPKRILDLMNVEKITRENVASHLQKYRLYLKRISSVANQQANMVAALGGPDSPYLRMNAVNFHNFTGSPQFESNGLRPIASVGVLGRLNTAAGLGLHGLSSSGLVQLGHGQIPRSSIAECTKFQPGSLPGVQTGTVLQGIPTSLEFDQFQYQVEELCPTNGTSRIFSSLETSQIRKNALVRGSSNSLLGLQGCSEGRQSRGAFGINSDSPSNLLDHSRCNSDWSTAVQSQPTTSNTMENVVPDISPNVLVQSQCQVGLTSDNMVQNVSYAPKQVWDDPTGFLDCSVNTSMAAQGAYAYAQSADQKSSSAVFHRNAGFGSIGQPMFDCLDDYLGVDMGVKSKQGQFMEQGRPLGNYAGNGAGSLEDIVTAMFKRV